MHLGSPLPLGRSSTRLLGLEHQPFAGSPISTNPRRPSPNTPGAHTLSCDLAIFFRLAGFLRRTWRRRASSDGDSMDRTRGFSRESPALKSVSSPVMQRGHARQPSSPQQSVGMGRVFRILNGNRPAVHLPSGACPGYATCT